MRGEGNFILIELIKFFLKYLSNTANIQHTVQFAICWVYGIYITDDKCGEIINLQLFDSSMLEFN